MGERLLALEGSLPTLESQAAVLGNLGTCYGRMGNMPKAIEFLERSLAINEGLGRLDSQAIQLGNLGNCYLTLGDIPNAMEFLLLSLALHEQLERVEDQALLLGNLGLAFRKWATSRAPSAFTTAPWRCTKNCNDSMGRPLSSAIWVSATAN